MDGSVILLIAAVAVIAIVAIVVIAMRSSHRVELRPPPVSHPAPKAQPVPGPRVNHYGELED